MFQYLNLGKYQNTSKKKGGNGGAKVETVKKTISKTGKVHYTGTPALKKTQHMAQLLSVLAQ